MSSRPARLPPAALAQTPPAELARALLALESRLDALARRMRPALARVDPDCRASAKNLVHYVALRGHDLRDLQSRLAQHGLSSLGRSESYVMGSLLAVSVRAHESRVLAGDPAAASMVAHLGNLRGQALSWDAAKERLHQQTGAVLGPRPDRHIYVMVTAPSAAEATRAWMVKLLRAGMNVLRINCAHEGQREWLQTIRALRAARAQTGKPCRVLMDLAGPKIRTGRVIDARPIVTWKPSRDELGGATAPAEIVLRRASAPMAAVADPLLIVGDKPFARLRKGDQLRFRDARGKRRVLVVHAVDGQQIVAHGHDRVYVLEKARTRLFRGGQAIDDVILKVDRRQSGAVDVKVGDPLILTGRRVAGCAPRRDGRGHVQEAGLIACTLPAALKRLAVGHRVLFDDGRIDAVVERVQKDRRDFLLRVRRTQKETIKLHAEKGINLPDTPTTVPSVTAEDRRALAFVAKHADAVGLSFVRRPEDVRKLHAELDRLKRSDIAVVLKIETRAGFENLPRILLEGLRRPPLAIMIARGDLAVEVGFERLAELQEEILWLCEAAHVPAIWATQVLDSLARTGVPSRAEVTDAAASVAAECVMLNKGPFIAQAVRTLSDILGRMAKHHFKKRSLFRKLHVSRFDPRAIAW